MIPVKGYAFSYIKLRESGSRSVMEPLAKRALCCLAPSERLAVIGISAAGLGCQLQTQTGKLQGPTR